MPPPPGPPPPGPPRPPPGSGPPARTASRRHQSQSGHSQELTRAAASPSHLLTGGHSPRPRKAAFARARTAALQQSGVHSQNCRRVVLHPPPLLLPASFTHSFEPRAAPFPQPSCHLQRLPPPHSPPPHPNLHSPSTYVRSTRGSSTDPPVVVFSPPKARCGSALSTAMSACAPGRSVPTCAAAAEGPGGTGNEERVGGKAARERSTGRHTGRRHNAMDKRWAAQVLAADGEKRARSAPFPPAWRPTPRRP